MRQLITAVVTVLVLAYTLSVVFGFIDEKHRIDGSNLALIAIAILCALLLLMPDVFDRISNIALGGLKLELRERVREIENAVSEQDKRIEQIIQTSMSQVIFKHLYGIALVNEYLYQDIEFFRREIYFLKDHGWIEMKPGHDRDEFNQALDKKNLVECAQLTLAGWSIIRLRLDEIPNWVMKDGNGLRAGIPEDIRDFLERKYPQDAVATVSTKC